MFGWFNHIELNEGGMTLSDPEEHPEVREYTTRRGVIPTDDESYFEWVVTSEDAWQEALFVEKIRSGESLN